MSENDRASERQEGRPEEPSPTAPPEASGPTPEQRDGLVRALRDHALLRKDPLAANVLMLSADLFANAAQLTQALAKESPEGPVTSSAFRNYEKKTDMSLKLARQIDRFSRMAAEEEAKTEIPRCE